MSIQNNIPINSQFTVTKFESYQKADIARLRKKFVLIERANKEYSNLLGFNGNLGDTISWNKAPTASVSDGLEANFTGYDQRKMTITIDQAKSSSVAYNYQQQMFFDQLTYVKSNISGSSIDKLGEQVEKYVATNGLLYPSFRAHVDANGGIPTINSIQQLDEIVSSFKDYGVPDKMYGIIPETKKSAIIGNMLGQFVQDDNKKLRFDWSLGKYAGCEWHTSSLLPIHIAGNASKVSDPSYMTVVSTNDPTGSNITQITFSGVSANDQDCIKRGDIITFINTDTNAGLRLLVFHGESISDQLVQVRAMSDAVSNGAGQVTVNVALGMSASGSNVTTGQPLISVATKDQNISRNIVAGMTARVLASHRPGYIWQPSQLYLGMPPIPTVPSGLTVTNITDPESKISIKMQYGEKAFENKIGFQWAIMYGACGDGDYIKRIPFAL